MKKIVTIVVVVMGLVLAGNSTKAQGNKIGYISLQELIPAMPEYRKADTSLNDYQNALAQNFEDMKKEFQEKDSLLNSKDTIKFTKAVMELKRKEVTDMYIKLQGWQQQAQQ